MTDLPRARKRLTDLVGGLRRCRDVHTSDGTIKRMTELQRRVFKAYARQVERVVEDDLQDE